MASRLQDVHLRGTRAAQPVATAVAPGTIYFVTDESVLERSDGSAWQSYSLSTGGLGISQLTGDVTAGPGSGSQVATIAAAAVTTAKLDAGAVTTAKLAGHAVDNTILRQGGATSVVGRAAGSTGDVADIAAAGDDTLLSRTAGTLSFTQITVGMLPNGVITYAKVQNVSATSRVLGRKTSGAGVIEECTLSDLLDFIGSAAQGDVLFRGASAWALLAAGTSGNFLKTNGPGADPSWASAGGGGSAAWTLVTSSSPTSGTSVDFTGLSAYNELRVVCKDITLNVGADNLALRVSTDNGSTFLAASGDYISVAGSGLKTNETSLLFCAQTSTSARTAELIIEGFNMVTVPKMVRGHVSLTVDNIHLRYIPTTSALNAVRVLTLSGGTFATGTIYVFGR